MGAWEKASVHVRSMDMRASDNIEGFLNEMIALGCSSPLARLCHSLSRCNDPRTLEQLGQMRGSIPSQISQY